MEIILKNGDRLSFSPDEILSRSHINAYNLVNEKDFNKSINLFYSCLGKLDNFLNKKKTFIGLKRSIVNEVFVNSSIFFFINFFEHTKIKNKIKYIEIVDSENYLKYFIKKYLKINLKKYKIKRNLKYNKIQILKQLNSSEILYYLKKKINNLFKNDFNEIVYKECPLLINKLNGQLTNTLYLRNKFNKKSNIKSKKKFKYVKESIICFDQFINSFQSRKVVIKIINDLLSIGYNNYLDNFAYNEKIINNFKIKYKAPFYSSQLTNSEDFSLMDLIKIKYNSNIITYQHGHGQGLSQYHNKIKFLTETSYSDINYVFSKNAKQFNDKENSFSISKTIISKYYNPFNKILTKLNFFQKKYDIIYFSPWHMNGINHSLYSYGINDFEKIQIETNLIKKYLSRSNYKILIKKYPYDSQKYKSEKFIEKLVSKYKNITFYNRTLKYPEFYNKKQIIIMYGCSSTFGYLASFNNPIIMINTKKYFPVINKLEKHFKKSIFLINDGEKEYQELMNKLILDKDYIYRQWEKKANYRIKFYKKYLGIN